MINYEIELVRRLTDFLISEEYRVLHEVPNMGQSVDIVCIKGRWVMLIEAKLTDWGRALYQCEAHELVADYITIGLARDKITKKLMQTAEIKGIGIITCDPVSGNCIWQRKPKWNKHVWKPQRRVLMKSIREKIHAC